MLKKHIYFGEKVKDYEIPVLNEREVRAGAGILFIFAISIFFNTWFSGNFIYLKIFVTIFMLDFIIRLFINPKYSPSLILGRIIVSNQEPEYAGAKQKKFAWQLGLIFAITMFILVVLNDIRGPINFILCIICLTLLYFESSFGICLGCILYKKFFKDEQMLCAGNSCKIKRKHEIQKVNSFQISILVIFLVLIFLISFFYINNEESKLEKSNENIKNNLSECEIPQWVININHEEMWKLHHGCKI